MSSNTKSKQENKRFVLSIKHKLIILMMLIALVPLITISLISNAKLTKDYTQSVQASLLTIVKSKETTIENYIESTAKIAEMIARTRAFNRLNKLSELPSTEENSLALNRAKLEVGDLLLSFQEANWGKYHHIFIIDKTKRIVISPNHGAVSAGSPSGHLNEDTSSNKWVNKAFAEGVTTVSDYTSWTESDHNHQMLFTPVRQGNFVIGFELQIPYQIELLTKDFKLGETGKVFLTALDGTPISYKGGEAKLQTKGMDEALRSGFSTDTRVNSEGIEVIDLLLKSTKYPWVLVAEIEKREVLSGIQSLKKYVFSAIAITAIASIVLAVLFSNLFILPIKKLITRMQMVGAGGKVSGASGLQTVDEGSRRSDEIGDLTRAFNRLITNLNMYIKHKING